MLFAKPQVQPKKRRLPPGSWIGARKGWDVLGLAPEDALVSLTPDQLKTHALVLGATGNGKTTLLHHLIAQDIALGHSFVILDLRGDLVSAALELCSGHVDPQRVKIIDLREKFKPFGFNPLYGSGEPYFRALSVYEAVAKESDSWGVQLAETLRNGLMILAENKEPITRLESLFADAPYRNSCIKGSESDSLIGFWTRFSELSADRQAALAMPVMNKVSLLLATKTLRQILGCPSPIDLERHLNSRGSITLISLAFDELHGAGRMMGNLVLSSICREVFARVNVPEANRQKIRLYVDEFEHFGSQEFETILAEGRRFGLSLVLSHQTLAQVSPKLRSLILGNVGTKIIFGTAREDGNTMNRDLFIKPTAYDFSMLGVGEAILWRRGREPIELEVNEPLLRNVGVRSAHASRFIQQVYSYAPKVPVKVAKPVLALPAPKPKPERQSQRPRRQETPVRPKSPDRKPILRANLEDWLCD